MGLNFFQLRSRLENFHNNMLGKMGIKSDIAKEIYLYAQFSLSFEIPNDTKTWLLRTKQLRND